MSRASLPLLFLALLTAAGCGTGQPAARPAEFGPAKLRIHPTFTAAKDWTGDGKPDGIEAVVEILDSYGEPTRGSGTLIFELWTFRKYDPDPLGNRVEEQPWRATLLTREEQAERWSPALRAYTFQLASAKVNPGKQYVLTASFETAGGADQPGGTRLFDRLILEPPAEKKLPGDAVKRANQGKGNR
ncbi:MAG TPA: hypothetical protein VF796_18925 [Humisphaera sp.]